MRTEAIAARKSWMGVLARADAHSIESRCVSLGTLPRYTWLRRPETGLMMVRGRIGGEGAKFNLGEVPVTRCAICLDGGGVGHAWVQGRDPRHAELAALLDALLQDARHYPTISDRVISPLRMEQAARREQAARKAAATKVDFYTLAREAQSAGEGK